MTSEPASSTSMGEDGREAHTARVGESLPREVRFALAFQHLVATLYDEYGEVNERVGEALQRMVKAGTGDD